jgi:pimeloyl-ACP methyl ester carboxylesterase
MAEDQIAVYRREVKQGNVVVFESSGHFVHFEEPERYASVVIAFVTPKQ